MSVVFFSCFASISSDSLVLLQWNERWMSFSLWFLLLGLVFNSQHWTVHVVKEKMTDTLQRVSWLCLVPHCQLHLRKRPEGGQKLDLWQRAEDKVGARGRQKIGWWKEERRWYVRLRPRPDQEQGGREHCSPVGGSPPYCVAAGWPWSWV